MYFEKASSMPARIERKYYLKVHIERSVALWKCTSGGMSW